MANGVKEYIVRQTGEKYSGVGQTLLDDYPDVVFLDILDQSSILVQLPENVVRQIRHERRELIIEEDVPDKTLSL